MKVAKLAAFLGETVEVGSFKSLRTEHPDIAVTLIVGKDDDDVRQRFARRRKGWQQESEAEKEC